MLVNHLVGLSTYLLIVLLNRMFDVGTFLELVKGLLGLSKLSHAEARVLNDFEHL